MEVPLAWAPDEHEEAAQAVLSTTRWALTGWKVMSELPNPVNFDSASAMVREKEVLQQFACGPDPERHLEQIQQFADAGFDHLVMQNSGPDPDGFMDFWSRELEQPIRKMAA